LPRRRAGGPRIKKLEERLKQKEKWGGKESRGKTSQDIATHPPGRTETRFDLGIRKGPRVPTHKQDKRETMMSIFHMENGQEGMKCRSGETQLRYEKYRRKKS